MSRTSIASVLQSLAWCAWAALPNIASATTTREDTPVVISIADLPGAAGCNFLRPAAMPGTGMGNITNNGESVYVTGDDVACADISASKLVWTPGLNQVASTTFKYTVNGPGPEQTLDLKIAPIVNDPPSLGNSVVNNGELLGVNSNPGTFTDWQVQGNVGHSYGGAGFNTGDTPPNGILQQVMSTVPGTSYTVNFQIAYGGRLDANQNLTISVTDGSPTPATPFGPLPGASLFNRAYGQQAGIQSFNFVATSTQTTLRIADTTANGITSSTDIALVYIHAFGGPPPQSLLEDGSLVFSSANLNGFMAADPDGEVTPYTLSASVAHGTLTLASTSGLTFTTGSDGSASFTISGTLSAMNQALEGLRYTPSPHFNGSDALNVSLNDDGSNGLSGVCSSSNPALPDSNCTLSTSLLVPLQIIPVNDAPTSQDRLGITVAEDTPYPFSAADFAFSDPIDAANGPAANALLGVRITSLPTTGTLTLAGAPVAAGQTIPASDLGQLVWTPAPHQNGIAIAQWVFQVQDDGGSAHGGVDVSLPHTISFNVSAVSDAPVAVDDHYRTQTDTALALTSAQLLGNDSDADGDTLTVTSVQAPVNGTVSLSGTNIIFTPAAGFVGTASFSYTISDGHGGVATATVTITISTLPVAEPTPVPMGSAGLLALLTLMLAAAAAMQGRRGKR